MQPFWIFDKRFAIPGRWIRHFKLSRDNQGLWLVFIDILNHDGRLGMSPHYLEASFRVLWYSNRHEVIMHINRDAGIFSVGPFVVFLAHVPYARHLVPYRRLRIKCYDRVEDVVI